MSEQLRYRCSPEGLIHTKAIEMMKLLAMQDEAKNPELRDSKKKTLIHIYLFAKESRIRSYEGHTVTLVFREGFRLRYGFDRRSRQLVKRALERVLEKEIVLDIVDDIENDFFC